MWELEGLQTYVGMTRFARTRFKAHKENPDLKHVAMRLVISAEKCGQCIKGIVHSDELQVIMDSPARV